MENPALFDPNLLIGTVSAIAANRVSVNLHRANLACGSFVSGSRYGLGEVGEFALIEIESGSAILARITETKLPEKERLSVDAGLHRYPELHPIADVQLLATIHAPLSVQPGIGVYPRLGARVYSAPSEILSKIPMAIGKKPSSETRLINLGRVKNSTSSDFSITAEKIFGRHCAILGATGGGKSYTVAKLVEEARKLGGKIILLDATGEYYKQTEEISHFHLGSSIPDAPGASGSEECSMPYTRFTESDFLSLFQPAGKTQGPKLQEAIKSLRLAKVKPELAPTGLLIKSGQRKEPILTALQDPTVAAKIENPAQSFDISLLSRQIKEECVFPGGGTRDRPDDSIWGGYADSEYGYCLSLITRINSIRSSPQFSSVFQPGDKPDIIKKLIDFLTNANTARVLRLNLEFLSFDFYAREIITNALGRWLLEKARKGRFRTNAPVVVFLDEAHQFLNKTLGSEDFNQKLDAFDLIAKEGRKYWLNICIATQRPRDIPDGVLSQMGTLIVHRLTNDKDREVVDRACGEIDRSTSAFLPNLEPGEAALIGVDFPIPLTIKIDPPIIVPESQGPDFQGKWVRPINLTPSAALTQSVTS